MLPPLGVTAIEGPTSAYPLVLLYDQSRVGAGLAKEAPPFVLPAHYIAQAPEESEAQVT